MVINTYKALFSEVLEKVAKAKTKGQKITILREENNEALRMVIKASFDPNIEWRLPAGSVPYIQNEAPEGTEHTTLIQEAKRLYHFIKGGNEKLTQNKREMMFVQMLEGLHPNEAELLVCAKDKKLHQKYKGLSSNVVKEAFGWNEDYVIPDAVEYPQQPGLASGPQ